MDKRLWLTFSKGVGVTKIFEGATDIVTITLWLPLWITLLEDVTYIVTNTLEGVTDIVTNSVITIFRRCDFGGSD